MSLFSMTPSFFALSIAKTTRIVSIKIVMYLINISLTILLINRWIMSGHFPLSNLYESLIFLSWSFSTIYSITSFTLRGQAKAALLPIISWSVAPITFFTCGYAFFCVPQGLQKAESLVPALQSNWLIMHVSVMILSYASLILGSLFAFSLLLIINFNSLNFSKNDASLFSISLKDFLYRFLDTLLMKSRHSAHSAETGTNMVEMVEIDHLSKDLKTAYLPLAYLAYFVKQVRHKANKTKPHLKNLFVNEHVKTPKNQIKQTATKNNSFLDNLSYRFIGLGFALLTLGIISGAVWANSAWGSYWSWDPKETWAFITWLTYAIYLHLRISKGWYGKQSAFMAVFGFFVVWFCYLGVNLFGKGLHSYAFV